MAGQQKETNLNQFNKFLDNNKDFLDQKYSEYFQNKAFKTKDVDIQKTIKYIYDVFSFQKYESDSKLNTTLKKSLTKNIQDHLGMLQKKMQQFNGKNAVLLLKFCIENNQMFAVKYDKKDKKMKTEEKNDSAQEKPSSKSSQEKSQQNQIQSQNDKVMEENKNESSQSQEQKKEENQKTENQFTQKSKTVSKYSQNQGDQITNMNQFETEQFQIEIDPQLVKKNMKVMFLFYCKQQISTGAHTTFDRINHQSSTMNLGKLIAFAKLNNLLNEKIDKPLIIRKFKLLAEGKKQIQFQKFYDLISIFAQIDEAVIPKLRLDEKEGFKSSLKHLSKAFNTHDLTSREVKRENLFIPVLTGHSGKTSDTLADEIKIRKQSKVMKSVLSDRKNSELKKQTKDRYERSRINKQRESVLIMSPKELSNSNIRDFDEDLRLLDKILPPDETEQQWMKEYQIPSHKNSQLGIKPPGRKQVIVSNIKKRVEELQRTQTRQSVHFPQLSARRPPRQSKLIDY